MCQNYSFMSIRIDSVLQYLCCIYENKINNSCGFFTVDSTTDKKSGIYILIYELAV